MSAATATFLGMAWTLGWLLLGRRRTLVAMAAAARGRDRQPVVQHRDARPSVLDVSVVIPARNEEARLPRLLEALASADPRPAEVIVVDDGSTDATAALALASGAHVIPVEPPPGWTGKAWACHRGADAATGDVLVFLDADTEPGPDALALLADAASGGALASAQPTHRIGHTYERISAGPAAVTVLGAGIGPPPAGRWWRRPMAFGPAIAIRRDVYRRIGGHAAVRSEVAEDLALAREADRAGVPVQSAVGADRLAYRMYPEGPSSLLEGWSKNLALGAGATPPLRLAAVVVWVGACLRAGTGPILDPLAATGLVAFAAFAVQFGVLLRRIGRFGALTALAYPLVLAGFLVLFTRSTLLVARGRPVPWRGRAVRVRT